MAIKQKNGFVLLVAVIFMSVMLSFGLALGSFSYKQQVLASSAIQSQYAFYAADAALECALYFDQQKSPSLFAHPPSAPSSAPDIICDNDVPISKSFKYYSDRWVVVNRLSLDNGTRCADVTVYKSASDTYLFSQGYNVSCATVGAPSGARFSSRGLQVSY